LLNLSIAAYLESTPTSMQVRATEVGQRAGECLLRRLAGERVP
jgi:DNA-binding LacI/PurR family transcriptional regulator